MPYNVTIRLEIPLHTSVSLDGVVQQEEALEIIKMLYIMYYALPCFKMYKDKGDKGLLLMLTVFNEVKRRILYGYYTLTVAYLQ